MATKEQIDEAADVLLDALDGIFSDADLYFRVEKGKITMLDGIRVDVSVQDIVEEIAEALGA